jgi:hypothetical protein
MQNCHRKVHKQCCPEKSSVAFVQITGLLSLSAIQDASPAEVYTFTLQQLKDDSMRG